MYPELIRNAWLEMTPIRRWSVPVVVFLLSVMVNASYHAAAAGVLLYWEGLQNLGLGLFVILGIWGSVKAMASVTSEVYAATWDLQRLAQHRPWELLAGKLFGSTVFEWYGSAFALALFTVGQLASESILSVALNVMTLVFAALLLQGLGVLLSLAATASYRAMRRPTGRGNNQGMGILIALLAVPMVGPGVAEILNRGSGDASLVQWWVTLPTQFFVPFSLAMFFGWTLVGGHRLIRAELQEPVGPRSWIAFMGFLVFYLYPLMTSWVFTVLGGQVAVLAATGALVTGSFVQLLMLGERKDEVHVRSLAAAWRRGDRAEFFRQLPLWTYTLVGYLASVALLGASALVTGAPYAWTLFVAAAALATLMVRDLGVILAVHLSPNPARQPAMVSLFYLAMIYVLLPLMFKVMGDSFAIGMFFLVPVLALMPGMGMSTGLFALLWGLPGVAVAAAVAVPRVRRVLKADPALPPPQALVIEGP